MTVQDQLGMTGLVFAVLCLIFFFGASSTKSYQTEDMLKLFGWVSMALAVVSFLLGIWGQGWLYG